MVRRIPPYERISTPPPLEVSSLDEAIFRHVRRHRFLRADQIARLCATPELKVHRRLHLLFHHGYLDRPRAQFHFNGPKSPRSYIYGLAKKGTRHLHALGEVDSIRIHEKRVGQLYLDHTVEVAEFMSRLERELPPGVHLEYLDDGTSTQRSVSSCSWSVPIHYKGEPLEVGVVPDRVFCLSTRDESLLFCLEVDRGTMPVIRTNPAQSSFYRKLLAYHETWRSGLHLRDLGWRRFRVLTVTSSRERKDHLIEVCKEVVASGGSGLFLFADTATVSEAEALPSMPWITGDGLNLAKLLSETKG